MRPNFLFSVVLAAAALAAPSVARAQSVWDSRGWVMLGERTVNGRIDHDRIEVGRIEGKFSKLTVVVENSDLEMLDFKIEFGDGTNYHPTVNQLFREGTRTKVIDLPPGEHTIRYLDFKYKNTPGGGNAKVGVWAWKIGDGAGPGAGAPPVPSAPAFNPQGWTLLGERAVNGHGREDHDRIEVGRYEGRFSKMTVVVQDADLEMLDMEVKFGRGESWHPAMNFFFREGTRSKVIDFPGDERVIKYIDFRYRNIPHSGHAKVQVWAKGDNADRDHDHDHDHGAWRFESKGWEMLGEREVHGHGRENTDRIDVGRAMGKFSKLTVVVLDSELEMLDFAIQFKHGEPFHPAVNYFFKEGTRTKVIELSNDGHERTIQSIEFKYRNVPGQGHAKVQVWAQ
jgi:hypothetical protein